MSTTPRRPKRPQSMGMRLGLKLDLEDDTEQKDNMEASFSHQHVLKRSKTGTGDVILQSGEAGTVTVTKGGGVYSTTTSGGKISSDDLKHISLLGKGASSHVDLVEHLTTGKMMALKVINLYDKSKRAQIVEEITALYHAKCPTLVDFYGAFFQEGFISIALEYMDQGCLGTVLENFGSIPEHALSAVAYQTLWGLAYLQHEKRVHRDIKPQNILMNSRGHVKLTDFGISRELENSIGMCNTFVGTFKYMSPERIQSNPYSYASDIWSLGLVLLECATGKYPYPECHTYIDMVQTVLESAPTTAQELTSGEITLSKQFQDFVGYCVRRNPQDRLPARILLGSPWLEMHNVTGLKVCHSIVQEWLSSGNDMDVGEGKHVCDETKFSSLSLDDETPGEAKTHK